jgi:hypothetical protein
MDTRDAPSPALLDALWQVVAQHGWHGTTFARIAERSGDSLTELRGRYATPVDLLRAHARVVDQQVLEGTVPGQLGFGSARDRVFDLLMRRFDALAPHREGILRLQRDLMRDPLSALLLSPILMASMAWTLEGAGVSAAGFQGGLRVQGLAGVWLAAARAWEGDESVDLGPTMAALDRALDRAESIARTLRLTEPEMPDGDAGAASPGVADPPLADTGIMMADASAASAPVPPSGLHPANGTDTVIAPGTGPSAGPEAPGAAPEPAPPRKPGGPGDMLPS